MIRYDTLPVHGSRTVFLYLLNIHIEPEEYRTESWSSILKMTSENVILIGRQYCVCENRNYGCSHGCTVTRITVSQKSVCENQ